MLKSIEVKVYAIRVNQSTYTSNLFNAFVFYFRPKQTASSNQQSFTILSRSLFLFYCRHIRHLSQLNIIGCGFLDLPDDATDEDIEAAFAADATRSAEQKANERILRSFCALAGGAVLPAVDALSLLTQVRSRTVGQVSLFRGPLRIGDTEIEVFAFGKTKQVNMPTLSKLSTVAPEAAGSDATHAVQMSRSYWNKLEDSAAAQEVQDDQKVGGFVSLFLPFSTDRHCSPKQLVPHYGNLLIHASDLISARTLTRRSRRTRTARNSYPSRRTTSST